MSVLPAHAQFFAFGCLTSLGRYDELRRRVVRASEDAPAYLIGPGLYPSYVAGLRWLREWGLGIAILVGLTAAYLAHSAGLGPVG